MDRKWCPDLAAALPYPLEAAETFDGILPGLFRRDPGRDALLDPQLDVEAKLIRDLPVDSIPMK